MSSVAEKLQRKSQRPTPTKQVRLKLVYVDFWSAIKLSFLIAVCGAIVLIVTLILMWLLLNQMGVLSSVSDTIGEILGGGFVLLDVFSLGAVATFALIVGAINVVVGTALGGIAALLYNLSVRLTGGLLVGFTNN